MKAIEFDNVSKTCYPIAIVSNTEATMRNYVRIDNAKVMAKWPTLDLEYAKSKYRDHKNYSRGRIDINGNPILFLLTFEEWIDIWMISGKWHLRGRKSDEYCMARNNDIGHYEVGNVKIITNEENLSEAHKGKEKGTRSAEHCANISAAKKGKPAWNKGKPSPKKGKPWSAERRAAQEAKKLKGK
jgi:hypothetical protein